MNREFISLKEIFVPSGSDRLRLLHESDEDGYDEFYTLYWDSLTISGWQTKVRLTDDEFQGSHISHRRIIDLHSIQPKNGLAVILVAEAKLKSSSEPLNYLYSWRLWDIVGNFEVARLKDCYTPSEQLVYQ
jgi:hypothetical protein